MELLSNTSDNSDNDSDDELIIDPNISFKSNSETDDESDCDTQWGEDAKEIDLNVDANVVVIFFTYFKTKAYRKT